MHKRTSDQGVCKRNRGLGQVICAILILAGSAAAQVPVPAPVFTDDSPEAAQWFARAEDQIRTGNTSEALRLYQRLLDQFPARLLAREGGEQAYLSVRRGVHEMLLADPDLLRGYVALSEPAAARLLAEGKRDEIYVSRYLTPSGLTASLDLAETLLARARFDSAGDLLRQCAGHPDLKGQARVRWATLGVLTGVYGERPVLVDQALEALGPSPDAERLRALATSLGGTFAPPPDSRAVGALDLPPGGTLRQMGKSPTWRFEVDAPRALPSVLRRRNWPDAPTDPRLDGDVLRLLSIMPVVASDFVYVHDGQTLTALDRFDGRPRWQADYRLTPQNPEGPRFGGGVFDAVSIQNDPTLPAIDQDRVVAIFARQVSDPDQRTVLACHDAGTGRRLWLTTPGSISADLSGALFVGVPNVHEGVVIVMVRKQTLRLASDFLAAIDLETGERLWHQHVASSAIFGYYSVLPSTVPLLHEGTVYLSSPLGAVASIEARTGLVRWLKVYEPFGSRTRAELTAPSQFDTMLMTPLGLVGFAPGRQGILVLDAASGEERAAYSAADWGEPRYLVSTGEALLAVGEGVVHISCDDPEDRQRAWVELRRDEFLTGRVATGAGRIFIPTNQRLRLLDPTGREIESAEISQLSVPVLVGGEIVLASLDRVDSYIPFAVGEPHLRARLEVNPHDPNPAISLARLAFQHRRLETLLPAIDRAIDIINADPLSEINATAQQRLFAGMLDMAPHSVLPDDLSGALYYRLELLAATPQQRLAYLLSHASSLAQAGQTASAIDAYQSILAVPALLAEPWTQDATTRPAGDVARSRLADLAATAGRRELYRPYEEAARREFDAARARGRPEDLLAVARQFPLAAVASEACIRASRLLRSEKRDLEAVAALRLVMSFGPVDGARGPLHAEILALYESIGWRFEALQLLRAIERADPAAAIPAADGRAEPIEARRTRLLADEGGGDRPARLGPLHATADIKEGQALLIPMFGRPSVRHALVRDNRNLVGYNSSGASQFIEILDSNAKDLLAAEDEIAVMALLTGRGQRTVEAFDMNERQMLWRSPPFEEWFAGQAAAPQGNLRPAVTSDFILLAEESGRIGCLDRGSGRVRWAVATALDRIRFISATESYIAVAGEKHTAPTRRTRREVASSHILLLRPETGALIDDLQTPQPGNNDVVLLSRGGEVIYSAQGRLHCYDAVARARRWVIGDDLFTDPVWAGIVGSSVLVFRDDGQAVRVDLASAALTPLPLIRPIERTEPPVLIEHLDRYVLKTMSGVYVLEGDGTVSGMMAGSGSPGTSVVSVAAAADRVIVVLSVESAARPAPRLVEVHTLDLTGRRLDRGFELDDRTEMPRPNGLQALDGMIVLDAGRDIVFIEAPVDGP